MRVDEGAEVAGESANVNRGRRVLTTIDNS